LKLIGWIDEDPIITPEETKMKTVYILTEGSYSDYHIVATFSTKELAEEAQKHCPNSDIEEYELDALEIPEHPPGHTAWGVHINAKTNTINWTNQQTSLGGYFKPNEKYYEGGGVSGELNTFIVYCWARDKEHAEKIALDKYYQWKWEKETEVTE
jgi:hypothetical protein